MTHVPTQISKETPATRPSFHRQEGLSALPSVRNAVVSNAHLTGPWKRPFGLKEVRAQTQSPAHPTRRELRRASEDERASARSSHRNFLRNGH